MSLPPAITIPFFVSLAAIPVCMSLFLYLFTVRKEPRKALVFFLLALAAIIVFFSVLRATQRRLSTGLAVPGSAPFAGVVR